MDFIAYTTHAESDIEYKLITTDEYEMTKAEIGGRKAVIKLVKGNLNVHAISTDNHGN